MTSTLTKLFCKILAIATVTGMLAACAPTPSAPVSRNLTVEMRRIQSSLDRQEQGLQSLASQVEQLENRLQLQAEELEQLRQSPQPSRSSYRPTSIPQSVGSVADSAQGEGSPTEVYLQAFGDYASGRYQAAIHGFETFLQRFPNNSYASNAQFWLGDCYFNQQQYSLAIMEFERILNEYPNAPKTPDALLKIAIAQLQLGDSDQARQAVNTLNQQYPKSKAAQKAQELAIP
jgi:tol-pal system protein YbgF